MYMHVFRHHTRSFPFPQTIIHGIIRPENGTTPPHCPSFPSSDDATAADSPTPPRPHQCRAADNANSPLRPSPAHLFTATMAVTTPLLADGHPRRVYDSAPGSSPASLRLDVFSNPADAPLPPPSALHSIAALWRAGYKSDAEIAGCPPAATAFYRAQNALLEDFREAAASHSYMSDADRAFLANASLRDGRASPDPAVARARRETTVRRAVIASNVANTLLLVAQIYAFTASGSLAVLATFLDAVLDFVSGLLILCTWMMKRRRDKHRYPVGRERLEPLGVMGMACLMTAATLLTLEESVSALARGQDGSRFVGITPPVAGVIVTALVTKFALYVYCARVDDVSVEGLCEDHRNDVISNVMSLMTAVSAQALWWWLDPVGGIVISCVIIRNWAVLTLEHCDQLLGKAADRNVINIITFMACNHSPEVALVDTVRAYHVGNGIFAEVDIVLARDKPLHQAHDIGESLQVRIEKLEGVERCFVHLDTETEHSPSIEHKEL